MIAAADPIRAAINPLVGLIRLARREPLEFFPRVAGEHEIVELPNPMGKFFVVNDPEMVGRVLETNYRNYPKSEYYQRIRPLFGDGLFELEGAEWKRKRQIVQHPFNRPNIDPWVTIMVEEIGRLFDDWSDQVRTGAAFDICPSLMSVTLNVISRVLCGTSIEIDRAALTEALATVMREGETVLWSLIPALRRLPTPQRARVRRALGVIDRMIYRLVTDRIDSGQPKGDLLDTLLAQRDEAGRPVSLKVIRDDLLTMLIAGHETTAAALGWAAMCLGQHPELQARLKAEADRVFGTRLPVFRDLRQLDYAGWTFQEALRLYPPFWTISRRSVEADILTGTSGRRYAVPAKATLMLCPYVMHRNARHWRRPAEFDPERFAPSEAETRAKWAFFPFGGGPRVCLGKHFAQIEGQLYLAMLAQRFTLVVAPGQDLAAEAMISLRPRAGIRMKIHQAEQPCQTSLAAE